MLLLSHLDEINYRTNNFLDKKAFSMYVFTFLFQETGVIPVEGILTGKDWHTWTWGTCFLGGLLSDVQEAACHCDSARAGSKGPRPARSIFPSAPGDAVQAFFCKWEVWDYSARGRFQGLKKTPRFATWERCGMLTAQDLKESSVLVSHRVHVEVNVTL